MGKVARFFQDQKIALAPQQEQHMLALDGEFGALESKVTVLEAQNEELRAGMDFLKQEVEQLKNQMERTATYDGGLDNLEVRILQILSSARGRVIAMSVSMDLGISETKADYYLSELQSAGFIQGTRRAAGQPAEYSLTELGREHLVRHNLV